MITLLITVIPSILILFYFIKSDKFKEPKKIIIMTFLLGVMITVPAGYLNHYILKIFSNGDVLNDALIGGFFAGGFVEEVLKFLVLYFYILKEKAFNEPMDAIVYGITVSLGFATLENFDYVYFHSAEYNISSLETAIIRSISAIPLHAVCGVMMGFYFGMYAFVSGGKNLSLALIVPYIFHGTYNFMVGLGGFYYLIVILIAIVFSLSLHSKFKKLQDLKTDEHEDKIV